jgi:hypothetical protein
MPTGILRKMLAQNASPVNYLMRVGEAELPLNPLLGQTLRLRHRGAIYCVACGRKTAKSYSQGYCYPCSQRLAECDLCQVKPELCHFAAGTCRQPEWGIEHCMKPHYIYLANSSGLKVGITRLSNVPTRWLDQGARQALPMLQASSRHLAGLVEVELSRQVADKTDWRKLLRGEAETLDLAAARDELLEKTWPALQAIAARLENQSLTRLEDAAALEFAYPVRCYPAKVVALNFDKTPAIEGELWGIKGQYLLLSSGVLNIRKFSGYEVEVEA